MSAENRGMVLPWTPIRTVPIPVERLDTERFWSRVIQAGSDDCWTWDGRLEKSGYAPFKFSGRYYYAHRIAYTLALGPIPPGLQIDHLCRNRACVNPKHLEVVNGRTNVARSSGVTAKRAANWLEGKCGNGHELAEVGLHKAGPGWTCAQCGRERVARYTARKRAEVKESA